MEKENIMLMLGRLESTIKSVQDNAINCRANNEKVYTRFENKLDNIIKEIKDERTIQKSNTKKIWKYLRIALCLAGLGLAGHLVTIDKESIFYLLLRELFNFAK